MLDRIWYNSQSDRSIIKEESMNHLREVRKSKGLSQFGLAKLADIHPVNISQIENGWLRPYVGWRKRLAEALQVSEQELFPGDGRVD